MSGIDAIRLIPPPVTGPVRVGYSGGLDSSVLLHLLANDPASRARGLRAVHVHHGLHADADAWARHCETVCAALDVPLDIVRVQVRRDSGLGLEGAAREARRRAFAGLLDNGECLALAQHRDDQAETFLLRALRASGPDGLAAIRPARRFAAGWLWRPLLETPRSALAAHAAHHGLSWIDDPSNDDTALARNFLRHHVLPLLRERWPHADAAFARSAQLSAESSDILAERDAATLDEVREDTGGGLSVPALRGLSPARRARLLRYWVAVRGWPPLPAPGIARIETDLIAPPARVCDSMPRFAWHGVEIRRWRDGLHAVDPQRDLPPDWSCLWDGRTPLMLPNGDSLRLAGIEAFTAPVRVHARHGGERLQLPGHDGHRRTLKHVLQALDIPPWLRTRMPLISDADGALLAAGDRVRSATFDVWLQTNGARLLWFLS